MAKTSMIPLVSSWYPHMNKETCSNGELLVHIWEKLDFFSFYVNISRS